MKSFQMSCNFYRWDVADNFRSNKLSIFVEYNAKLS